LYAGGRCLEVFQFKMLLNLILSGLGWPLLVGRYYIYKSAGGRQAGRHEQGRVVQLMLNMVNITGARGKKKQNYLNLINATICNNITGLPS
jgi:hypothetical protein